MTNMGSDCFAPIDEDGDAITIVPPEPTAPPVAPGAPVRLVPVPVPAPPDPTLLVAAFSAAAAPPPLPTTAAPKQQRRLMLLFMKQDEKELPQIKRSEFLFWGQATHLRNPNLSII
jgi:hypothetical protein